MFGGSAGEWCRFMPKVQVGCHCHCHHLGIMIASVHHDEKGTGLGAGQIVMEDSDMEQPFKLAGTQ
jgi:hypothetical protein